MPGRCMDFREHLGSLWSAAVEPPFIEGCKDGTISQGQFNTWLVQDYHYVLAFTRFLGQTLAHAHAPVEHMDALLSGLSALRDELTFFRAKADERKLDLIHTIVDPINQKYASLLQSLYSEPYHVQAPALWAIELVYGEAWQIPGEVAAPYREFAQRWGNPQFMEYVKVLERQADEALAGTNQEGFDRALQAVEKIFKMEVEFWQMAMNSKEC